MIDPATHDIVQNVYIRRVEKRNGKLANIEFETYPNVKDIWKEMNPAEAAIAEGRVWAPAGGGEPPAFAVSESAARARESRP